MHTALRATGFDLIEAPAFNFVSGFYAVACVVMLATCIASIVMAIRAWDTPPLNVLFALLAIVSGGFSAVGGYTAFFSDTVDPNAYAQRIEEAYGLNIAPEDLDELFGDAVSDAPLVNGFLTGGHHLDQNSAPRVLGTSAVPIEQGDTTTITKITLVWTGDQFILTDADSDELPAAD